MSVNNFVGMEISENMEGKGPEITNAIQNASHRIYHEMLKNVDHANKYETDDIKKETQEQISKETNATFNRTKPLNINDFHNDMNCLSEMSSDGSLIKMNQPIKPPRPPPLHSYSLANEALKFRQKNAICSVELSEGEAAASKLQDMRLIKKGLSKSVATNLNVPLHSGFNEEHTLPKKSSQNSTIPRETQHPPIVNSSTGTFIINHKIVC